VNTKRKKKKSKKKKWEPEKPGSWYPGKLGDGDARAWNSKTWELKPGHLGT
jgi:hypothetical protein